MIKNNKLCETKHIINTLYKIKQINRRKMYSTNELRRLVFSSKYGYQVIKQLQEKEITCEFLKRNGLTLVLTILGPKLKDK